jgi:uncharacterized protein involved in exopolysaccharide biosynthesis/Mrp family chromosome partitioning ATPase
MATTAQSTARPWVVPAIVDELDLTALGRALWRRKFAIAVPTLAAAALAFAAVNFISPRYKSEARVLIESRENIFLRPEADKALESNAMVDQEAVASQVQLILSRDLAHDIIEKLKLRERAEFDPVLRGPSLVRTLLGFVGAARDPMTLTPEERALKSFQDRLSAYQAEKSRVIVIEFESEEPELAARAANAVAEQYLILQQSAKQAQARAAGQWLAGEIEKLRVRVTDAEARTEQQRSRAGLFIGANNVTLSAQQLGEVNVQLAAARARKADAEAKSRLIRDALHAGGPIEFSDVANSELMRRLSEQRITLRAQLAEQSSTLLDGHPRIKELRAQIADLEGQTRAEADRIGRALENDARVADARMSNLTAALEQLKHQASVSNEQDVALRALEREAKSQRDLLESYLAKYREATARDSIDATSPDARIISTATASSTPSWPKRLPIVLVASLGTLALSVGFVVTGELLAGLPAQSAALAPNPSAGAPDPPVEPPGAAVAGGAGRGAPCAPAPRMSAPARSPREAIEELAGEILAAGEAGRRITVVGPLRDGDAVAMAIMLARSLSGRGRVVLVEAPPGSDKLSAIAADPAARGIAELIGGAASFGDIITRDRYSRLHLVLAGRAAVEMGANDASERLSLTLEALGRSYDHLIIDASALPGISAERFAQVAPHAVLVASEVDDPVAARARERLMHAGFNHVSVLANAQTEAGAAAQEDQAAA